MLLLLLFLAAFSLSWWLAPRWLPPLAQNLADEAGVRLIELAVGRPGWRGWHIDSLRLQLDSMEISAADVDIGWQCCRQIDKSLVAEVQWLRVRQSGQALGSKSAGAPLALTFLLNSLAQRIPFVKLKIAQLTAVRRQPSPVTLEISRDQNRLLVSMHGDPLLKHSKTPVTGLPAEAPGSAVVLESASPVNGDAGFSAQLEWRSPASLILNADYDGSVINLLGNLDDKGFWNWSGRYHLHLLEVAEFLGTYFPGLTIPDQGSAKKLSIDQFNLAGQFTASTPDVLGYGEWQLQVNNTLDAHLETPLAVSVNSQQSLAASGVTQLQKLILSAPRNNFFLEKQLPWQYLPRRWQLTLQNPLVCSVENSLPDSVSLSPEQSSQQVAVSLPVEAENLDKSEHFDTAIFSSCLSDLTLYWRSLDSNNVPVALEIDTVTNLSAIEKTVRFSVDANAQFDIGNLPRQVALKGEFGFDSADRSLAALSPVTVSWLAFPLTDELSLSGDIKTEHLQFDAVTTEQVQVTAEWSGAVNLDLADQPLMASIQAATVLNARELYLPAGELTTLGLHVPFEFKWKMAERNGWLSLKSTGKLAEVPAIDRLLPGLAADFRLSPGFLQSNSFFHFGYSDEFTFKGRTQVLMDDWQVDWGATDSRPLQLRDLLIEGDIQYDHDSLRILSPLQVQAGSAYVGVPLQNIAMKITGKAYWHDSLSCQLQVTNAQLSSFGGEVKILQPVPVECPLSALTIPMAISRIDLGELIAVESDKVKASGQLAGTLPVSYRQGQVSIENGWVAAQGPGNISLTDPAYWRALASGDESMELTLGILQNFDYDALSVGINLDQTGLLSLTTRVRGRNSGFQHPKYKGQVVDLNLNIENNLLQLLRSMALPTTIEQRVQQVYE